VTLEETSANPGKLRKFAFKMVAYILNIIE